jgi:hypothetical protein
MDAFEPHARSNSFPPGAIPVTVLVDANNVRRSVWPNVSGEELVERCRAWARAHGYEVVPVFDGSVSADDQIAERALQLRAESRAPSA